MVPNPEPTAETGPKLLEYATWLEANWMIISTYAAFILLILLCVLFRGSVQEKLANHSFVAWLVVVAYMVHQTEEHYYDLRGWRYAFVPDFNHGLGKLLFPLCDDISHLTCPVNTALGMYINVFFVWLSFPLTILVSNVLGGKYFIAGYLNWGFAVANGLMGHIVPMILTQEYNPGVFQSLVMVPLGIWLIVRRFETKFLPVCILNGILAHIIFAAVGINIIFHLGAAEETEILWCIVAGFVQPLLIVAITGDVLQKMLRSESCDSKTVSLLWRAGLMPSVGKRSCSLGRRPMF